VEESPVVAGVSISPDGTPEIVLDPAALASHAGGAPRRPERAARARPKILVVDDSLTTRMLERSILESAGFEVELAVSGEEGLAKARERRYSLYLVDIEMPGMDGFAFLRQVGGDGVPAMMVTSRSSPEDRRRSEECGARGYIVKSEFDQGRLLRKIGELIG
jgi:two-component system chemotaxis sensor kinase CheA